MRKIILGLAISLDSFIEGSNGEYDWCFTDQDYGMTEFLSSVDAIFYGRKSYEMMQSASPEGTGNPWSDKKNYVFFQYTSIGWKRLHADSGEYYRGSGKIEIFPG